ncbi:substrate-binding periplasmic protein [Bdellovibrio bacteriovorus]|uniref:substrate-binding periplasmic protein n=1 Tax=Bdellovibrio bacteriovorus TaxID=959 RepID=UPI003AA7C1BE
MKTRLFLLPIIIFCFSAVASAKDCGRRFRIIVNNYAPLFDVNNEGHVHGLTFEFMNELSVRLGCIVSQAPMDAPRMHDDFKNWRADIVGLVIPSEKFRSSGEYVPVYSTVRKLLVNKAFYDPARSIADYIKDGRIKFGDQIGTRFFLKLAEKDLLIGAGRIVEYPSPATGYRQVVSGRVQAMFTSPAVYNYYQKVIPDFNQNVVAVPDPEYEMQGGIYLSLRRISKSEAEQIRKAISDMRKDGTLRRIVAKYTSAEDMVYYKDL